MAVKRLLSSCAFVLCVGAVVFLVSDRVASAATPSTSQPALEPAPALQNSPSPLHSTTPQPATTAGSTPDESQPMLTSTDAMEQCEGEECAPFSCMQCCSPPGRVWLRADYLMWWTNGVQIPPLVTTSPQGTPVAEAGVLGLPTTTILYGDTTIGNGGQSGVRTILGTWLDSCHRWGIEFDYLTIGENDSGFNQVSTGNPILTRPFFNVQTNQQASELVAYPNTAVGSVSVDAKDYFQSAGALLSYNLCCCNSCCDECGEWAACESDCGACCAPMLHCCRTDLVAGFRYYNLSDALTVHETPSLLQTTAPHNLVASFDIHDNFRARNDFYGGEVGLRTRLYRNRWSLEILTKIAAGNNHQTVNINGTTDITTGGQTRTYTTGILAGPNNSGVFQRDVFTMIPELNIELGYQLNSHWRAYVGYDILYWDSVYRAASQIDLNLDPRNFPPAVAGGLPFPAFQGRTNAFWAQGVNVGTEFRF